MRLFSTNTKTFSQTLNCQYFGHNFDQNVSFFIFFLVNQYLKAFKLLNILLRALFSKNCKDYSHNFVTIKKDTGFCIHTFSYIFFECPYKFLIIGIFLNLAV